MEIVDRIKKIVETEGVSYRSFEANIGKSNGYIKQVLEKKGSLPSVDVILTIIDKYPNYNLMWLLTGEGGMIKGEEEKEKTPPVDARFEDVISEKVVEMLKPFIQERTDDVIRAVMNLHLELARIKNQQAKTHEKVEVIEKRG